MASTLHNTESLFINMVDEAIFEENSDIMLHESVVNALSSYVFLRTDLAELFKEECVLVPTSKTSHMVQMLHLQLKEAKG